MANHKSATKRNRQNAIRRARNMSIKSSTRTALKTAREAIASGADNKQELVQKAVSQLYRAKSKKVFSKQTTARTISRLVRAANAQ